MKASNNNHMPVNAFLSISTALEETVAEVCLVYVEVIYDFFGETFTDEFHNLSGLACTISAAGISPNEPAHAFFGVCTHSDANNIDLGEFMQGGPWDSNTGFNPNYTLAHNGNVVVHTDGGDQGTLAMLVRELD
jgi:hypothetical protein